MTSRRNSLCNKDQPNDICVLASPLLPLIQQSFSRLRKADRSDLKAKFADFVSLDDSNEGKTRKAETITATEPMNIGRRTIQRNLSGPLRYNTIHEMMLFRTSRYFPSSISARLTS